MKPEPGSSRRRTNKYWIPYAWAVRVLVDRGHGVTESVRTVLARAGKETTDSNVACLRVVYYNVRKLMWPPEYQHLRGRQATPPVEEPPAPPSEDYTTEDDDFEI